MDNGIQPVLPVGTGYGNGGFGGGFGSDALWIFAILALFGGRGGFFGGNGGYQPQYATQQDVQYTSQFGQLLDGNRDILGAISTGTAQAVAATSQAKYDAISSLKDTQAALTAQLSDIRGMEGTIIANQQECCCNTLRALDNVNFGISNAMNSINANTTAGVQKILDTLSTNKINDLTNRINQLELANAVSGVVRYPNSIAYSAGQSPFCNTGCGCNNF